MSSLEILLPYYGDPTLMRAAVDSVVAQSNPDWRLYVLDDAYPDEQIARWLEVYDDDRVVFERSPRNLGVNSAFQTLLQRSSADYVMFFGCDDILLPSYVDRVRRLLDEFPDAAMIQPGVRVIDSDGRTSRDLGDRVKGLLRSRLPKGPAAVDGERLAASLLTGNWAYFPSIVWKRSRVAGRGFREGLEVVLDLDLLFGVIAAGGQMVLDSEVVFEYRRHASSVSSQRAADGRRFREEQEFFARAAKVCHEAGWRWAELAARAHPTSRAHRWLARLPRA